MASVGSDDGDSLSLNLMPMLDIFSILIVFLLMSYSTDPVTRDATGGLELPESVTLKGLDELPAITVKKTEILVNDKVVATIQGGDVPENLRMQGAILPVFKALEQLAEANKRVLQRTLKDGDKDKLSTLTMELDKKHKFRLMRRIMLSAQQAEYVTFKMMVSKQTN